MKAFQIAAFGAVPQLVEVDRPEPGPGQVVLQISACALNFADLLMIEGRYQQRPDPPVTLGMEVAGHVAAVGPGVDPAWTGRRVAVHCGQDGLAQFGVFPVARCLALPDTMPMDVAAALQVAHGTGHLALARRARVRAGDRVLVLGAAGGVGLAAVQIARALGANVVAVARGADRLEAARAAGAAHCIDSDAGDLTKALRDLGRMDVVYDAVGGAQFQAAFRAMRPEGRILSIGFASGEVPQIPANHLMVKNIDVIGVNWGAYAGFAPEAVTDSLRQVLDWYAEGRVDVHIGHRLPLDRVAEGLDLLRNRRAVGKVVIEIAES